VSIRAVYAGLLAWMAMLCVSLSICGDAGTGQGSTPGGMWIPWWGQQTECRLARGISTLHYGGGNDIPTAMMDLKTWDPDPGMSVRGISTLHYGVGNDISTASMRAVNTGQRYVSTSEVQAAQQMYDVLDTGQLYESTSGVQAAQQTYDVLDTGQLYESTSGVQAAQQMYEVLDTGQLYKCTSAVQEADQLYEVWDMGVVIQKRQLYRPPHHKQLPKSPQQKQLSRPPDQRQLSRPPQQKHSTPPPWSLCVTTPPPWCMEAEVPELGQMHESNTELWDTGQKAHKDKHARSEFIVKSAFFGWCTFRGTNAEGKTSTWRGPASQDMIGLYGVHQQREEHGHLGQLGAGHAHHQQVRQVVLPSGRPPEEVSGSEKAPGYDEVCSCDDSSGNGCKDVNNDITQKSSFRNKYEQKLSVLEGGGTSLVVKCRLHEKQNKSSAAFHLGSPRGEKSGQAQALWLAGRHI